MVPCGEYKGLRGSRAQRPVPQHKIRKITRLCLAPPLKPTNAAPHADIMVSSRKSNRQGGHETESVLPFRVVGTLQRIL